MAFTTPDTELETPPDEPQTPQAVKPSSAPSKQPTGPFTTPHEDVARPLVSDESFDPAAYYAADPSNERLAVAREAFKQRAQQPIKIDPIKIAGAAGKGVLEGIAGLVKGGVHAASNIATEISPFASEADQQRAQRENAAAIQSGAAQGADLVTNKIPRNIQRLFGKTDRTLSDQEIDDLIQHQAAYNSTIQDIQKGNLVEGGLVNEGLGIGRVQRNTKSPEELEKLGAPVDPEAVQNMSFVGDPTSYALLPAAEVAAPLISKGITAPILKAAGKVAETAAGPLRFAKNAYSFFSHGPLATALKYSTKAAEAAASGEGRSFLTEAGQEAAGQALPPVGQSIFRKATKEAAKAAVGGTALSAPYVAGAQSPEEAAGAIGGGFGIGGAMGAFGGIKGSRQIETAAKYGQLVNEGRAIKYGTGEDAIHDKWKATLPKDAQNAIDVFRGYFNGQVNEEGIPMQIYVAGGQDYANALKNNGANGGEGTRGFITPDGTKVYINADSAGNAAETNATLAHESAGHMVEFLADIAKDHDLASLRESLASTLYQNGQPTKEFKRFIDLQKRSLLRDGVNVEAVDAMAPDYFEREILAQHAADILNGENIANFALPQSLKDKMETGARRWLRSKGIMSPRGGDIGWGATGIKDVTDQLRNILYNRGKIAETARKARQQGGEDQNAINARIEQLQTILARRPVGTDPVSYAKEYANAVKELNNLTAHMESNGKADFPAAGPEPIPPSAPKPPASTQAHQQARSDAIKSLVALGDKQKAAQGFVDAAIKELGPIEDSGQLVKAALQARKGITPTVPIQPPAEGTRIEGQQPTNGGNTAAEAGQLLAGAGKGITDALYTSLIEKLKKGDLTEGGRPSILLAKAKPLFDAGKITNAADLKTWVSDGQPDLLANEAPSAPSEPVPTSPEQTVVEPVETGNAVATMEPEEPPVVSPQDAVTEEPPIDRQAVAKMASDAAAAALASKEYAKKRTEQSKRNHVVNAVSDAILNAMGPDAEGLNRRTDEFGNTIISGDFDPENPYHQALAELTGMTGDAMGNLVELQAARDTGQPVHILYQSAEKPGIVEGGEGSLDTGMTQRQKEYEASPSQERAKGKTDKVQIQKKTILPVSTWMTSDGHLMHTVFTAENLFHNAQEIVDFMRDKGIPNPYVKMDANARESAIISDFNKYVENHQNGYKGDGSGSIISFAGETPRANPDYTPQKIDPEKFALLNMMMHDEKASQLAKLEGLAEERLAAGKGLTTHQAKRISGAREAVNRAGLNGVPIDPASGETNALRSKLKAEGFTSQQLKSPFENLEPENILQISDTPIDEKAPDVMDVRPTEFSGEASELVKKGKPNAKAVSSGFMPSEATPDSTIYREPGKTIDISSDVTLPKGWNLTQDGGLWIVKDDNGKIIAATGSRAGTMNLANAEAAKTLPRGENQFRTKDSGSLKTRARNPVPKLPVTLRTLPNTRKREMAGK